MTAVPPPFNVTFQYFATSLDDGTKYSLTFPWNYHIIPDSLKDKHSTTFKTINIETNANYLYQTRHPEGQNGYLILNPDEPVDKWISTFIEIVDEDYDESEDDYWVCDCHDCNRARINKEIRDAKKDEDEENDDFCEDCYYGHCPEHRGDYETDEDEDDNDEPDLKPQFEIVESFDDEDDLEDFDYDVKSDCSDDSDYEFEDDVDDENDNDYDVEEFDDDDVEEPQDYDDGYPILYWDEEEEDEDEEDLYTITTDDGRKISIGPSLRATGVTNKTLKFENGQFVFKFDEEKQEKPKYNFIRTERTLRNKTYTSTIKQKI